MFMLFMPFARYTARVTQALSGVAMPQSLSSLPLNTEAARMDWKELDSK